MREPHVFSDPSGHRWRVLTRLGTAAGLVAAVFATIFLLSLLAVPWLPPIKGLSDFPVGRRAALPAPENRQERLGRFLLGRAKKALRHEITRPARRGRPAPAAAPAPADVVVAAFYAPWQETGLHSFRANAQKLTHVFPEWLHLDASGAGLDTRDWDPALTPHNLDVVQIARGAGVEIHPILNNAHEGIFDPERVHSLLASAEAQRGVAGACADFLSLNGFQGLNLDFENLSESDLKRLPAFVRLLAATLHARGLGLSVDVEAQNPATPMTALADAADFVILMAYDEHYEGGDPGPICSQGWFEKVLDSALAKVPSGRLVVGLGGYAYDWSAKGGEAESISYQEALLRVRDNRPDDPVDGLVTFDRAALNPTATYSDDDGTGHTVWLLDGTTAYNEWIAAAGAGVRGAALWALGSEDPGVWSVLGRQRGRRPPPPSVLENVDYPYDVEFDGEGEILAVEAEPTRGVRLVTTSPESGLVTAVRYLSLPSSFVIRREGFVPRDIALTFDDGPDPVFTPEVLDVLRAQHVPGTFFVIGESAENHPDLVRREYAEGHEIGSHTFTHPNLGAVSPRRASLELNATQRAIESILGRSTILFRPPYNADAEPVSAEEVTPIEAASRLGYITVGERIDPQDWSLYEPEGSGKLKRRTVDDILSAIRQQLQVVKGNVILLHDGGGDRSLTVASLKILIPELRKDGHRFVLASELAGLPRDAAMPALTRREHFLVGADRAVFEFVFRTEFLLRLAFLAAIGLGVARVMFLVPLALAQHRRDARRTWDAPESPRVSAVVAAFNEAPVIERTIGSLLASDPPPAEVIVVDDGSTDGTADVVAAAFDGDPRVRVIRQANAGKAAALNRALEEVEGDVVVCLDADTLLEKRAVGLLARHFSDPRVAAVAGNVKVGNPVNLLTTWQALEYVTSQNLDRRAYALFNTVNVVPGAAGAWRTGAVREAGGFHRDTMAEDMDLTWRLTLKGWRVASECGAVGLTEAPQSIGAFARQRFRWTYGTLQCLWKHRRATFRHGWFGWVLLPTLWLFQVVFQVLAPLVDLQILYSLGAFVRAWIGRAALTHDWQPLPQTTHRLYLLLLFYALFFAVDLVGAFVALRLDRERLRGLWWLFLQRFVYRQVMYAVLWKSLAQALKGVAAGWGKSERRGTVRTEPGR